jgi:GSCFA family
MEFRTEINLQTSSFNINYFTSVMFVGSCFSENMGNQFEKTLIPVNTNPFGVIYNPASVKRNLEILIEGKQFMEEDLHFYNELWYSWDHHSSFSNTDKRTALENINQQITDAGKFLKSARYLFITFGSAWVYSLKENDQIVCNCHKLSASAFNRSLLQIEEIVDEYRKLIKDLRAFNPDLKIIFTLSPVRHWKDGAHGNQISKSILLLSIEKILSESDNTGYFPSYEIMLDDLRDYRFYAEDMIHPNKLAIDYLWEKFSEAYFDKETLEIIHSVIKIQKALSHRVSFIGTESYQKFMLKTKTDIQNLAKKYPDIDFSKLKM